MRRPPGYETQRTSRRAAHRRPYDMYTLKRTTAFLIPNPFYREFAKQIPCYPFTAPAVRPLMNCFCMHRYSTTIGKDARITLANTKFHWEVYAPMAL